MGIPDFEKIQLIVQQELKEYREKYDLKLEKMSESFEKRIDKLELKHKEELTKLTESMDSKLDKMEENYAIVRELANSVGVVANEVKNISTTVNTINTKFNGLEEDVKVLNDDKIRREAISSWRSKISVTPVGKLVYSIMEYVLIFGLAWVLSQLFK